MIKVCLLTFSFFMPAAPGAEEVHFQELDLNSKLSATEDREAWHECTGKLVDGRFDLLEMGASEIEWTFSVREIITHEQEN